MTWQAGTEHETGWQGRRSGETLQQFKACETYMGSTSKAHPNAGPLPARQGFTPKGVARS